MPSNGSPGERQTGMRDFARRSSNDRSALFRVASQAKGINEAIIEKDFWVCWVLDLLFSESPWKESLNFKGGTSLSKAYNLIQRFSEDIDLIIDWRLLGYKGNEPWESRSNSAQDRFVQEANDRAASFIRDAFVPGVRDLFSRFLGEPVELEAQDQNVHFRYPRSFNTDYMQPVVLLEMGPMAAWVPCSDKPISPYVVDVRPDLFMQRSSMIRTVDAERTFWEKATILHQEAHRSMDKKLPQRYSRHYYDFYRLLESSVKTKAMEKIGLLREVIEFKQRFYRCPWSQYEDAMNAGLRLSPSSGHLADLRKDYRDMKSMLFGEVPDFDSMMAVLANFETEFNSTALIVKKATSGH